MVPWMDMYYIYIYILYIYIYLYYAEYMYTYYIHIYGYESHNPFHGSSHQQPAFHRVMDIMTCRDRQPFRTEMMCISPVGDQPVVIWV